MALKALNDDTDGFAIRATEKKIEKRDGPAVLKKWPGAHLI